MSEETKNRRLNVVMSESEIERLSAAAEHSGMSMSAFVRLAVDHETNRRRERELEEAAEALASMYELDSELTVFTALDGEDFE
jgi:post-segregation antitoxin (ccd killing protein)